MIAKFFPASILLIVLMTASACSTAVTLKGTDLGKDSAPDFRLTDQDGKAVALSDFHNKVVVLTFLYTHCPDECPLIASKLHGVSAALGNAMNQVAFVAVSVDPANDTPAAIKIFNARFGLNDQLRYLSGTPDQLAPVWKAYALYVAAHATDAATPIVDHTARVIVIDKAGSQRANFGSDFAVDDLTFDIRALLNS